MRDLCSRVIKNAKQQLQNSRYGEDALSMQLAMVGNDMGARKFLEGEFFFHCFNRRQFTDCLNRLYFLFPSRSFHECRGRQGSYRWRSRRYYWKLRECESPPSSSLVSLIAADSSWRMNGNYVELTLP